MPNRPIDIWKRYGGCKYGSNGFFKCWWSYSLQKKPCMAGPTFSQPKSFKNLDSFLLPEGLEPAQFWG